MTNEHKLVFALLFLTVATAGAALLFSEQPRDNEVLVTPTMTEVRQGFSDPTEPEATAIESKELLSVGGAEQPLSAPAEPNPIREAARRSGLPPKSLRFGSEMLGWTVQQFADSVVRSGQQDLIDQLLKSHQSRERELWVQTIDVMKSNYERLKSEGMLQVMTQAERMSAEADGDVLVLIFKALHSENGQLFEAYTMKYSENESAAKIIDSRRELKADTLRRLYELVR